MHKNFPKAVATAHDRRSFIGGSDARVIMGTDQAALLQLWREKRGEAQPEDLSGNLVVQLGRATEELNRCWYEASSGQEVTDIQKHLRHLRLPWMGATLDGRVRSSGAVFEAKFMLPWSFSEEAGGGKVCAATPAQHVGGRGPDCGALDHYRRRQMGRDQGDGRSALSTPDCHSRAEVLALRRERRAPYPARGRSAKAARRGRSHGGYEHLQCLGGVGSGSPENPLGPCRA